MERRFLNLYLKHIKKIDKKIFKKVALLPKRIVTQLIIIVILLIISVISAILSQYEVCFTQDLELWRTICTWIYLVSIALSVVVCVISNSTINRYEINVSDTSIREYWNYCTKTKTWITNELMPACRNEHIINQEVRFLKKRIDRYRREVDAETAKREERTHKWVQTLAIPLVLAIITAAINKNDNWEAAVQIIVATVLIGATIFSVVWVFNLYKSIFRKQKSEQLKFFSDDLQGVLDMQHYAQYLSKDN